MQNDEDEVLLLPGEFKDCLLGFEVHSNVAIYSKDKVIEVLLKNMNYQDIDELLKLSSFIIKKVLRKIWLALK